MKLTQIILRSLLGLVIGAGVGAVLGFVRFTLAEKIYPSGLFVAPSGGLPGALLMGLVGVVLGLITGAFGLRPIKGAALGPLIFLLLMLRALFAGGYVGRRSIFMDLFTLSLAVDFAIIGAVVALSLRYLPGGNSFADE